MNKEKRKRSGGIPCQALTFTASASSLDPVGLSESVCNIWLLVANPLLAVVRYASRFHIWPRCHWPVSTVRGLERFCFVFNYLEEICCIKTFFGTSITGFWWDEIEQRKRVVGLWQTDLCYRLSSCWALLFGLVSLLAPKEVISEIYINININININIYMYIFGWLIYVCTISQIQRI